jgi:hypothetical protein
MLNLVAIKTALCILHMFQVWGQLRWTFITPVFPLLYQKWKLVTEFFYKVPSKLSRIPNYTWSRIWRQVHGYDVRCMHGSDFIRRLVLRLLIVRWLEQDFPQYWNSVLYVVDCSDLFLCSLHKYLSGTKQLCVMAISRNRFNNHHDCI